MKISASGQVKCPLSASWCRSGAGRMAQELVSMSTKELDRVDLVRRVIERRLTQVKAAELMGLSARQVRRLCIAYQQAGPIGLASRKRGQPSNRRLPPQLQAEAVEIVRERYADFGPKLAQEKLLELHHIRVHRSPPAS